MKLNKQGNIYTVAYLMLIVVIVGAGLAFTSMGLKDRQQANADSDKMRQILMSAHITTTADSTAAQLYAAHIKATPVYNSAGQRVGDNAFEIDMAKEAKKPVDKRLLPVFDCIGADGLTKYIIPLAGNGLWGPIWGYVALNANGMTVYGAYFAHQGETPGLGAEIAKPAFSDQFDGKRLFVDDQFLPVTVVKKGQLPQQGEDYVDGISGGTITSRGVADMLSNCLEPYEMFIESLKTAR